MTNEKELVNFQNTQKQTRRNGLIELYRFLFAMWVVWYHGFFAFKNQFFNNGYIAVEFFFILSGFYIIKSIDKQSDKPFFTGLWNILWSRIKALRLPFIVGLIFAFWYMFLDGQISMLGYLWYIPFMLLSFVLVYVLKRLIKNKAILISCLIGIVVISYLLLYIPILKGWGLFRGFGGVCLGVLVSQIPKINLKIKSFDFNWIITGLLFGIVLYLAYLPKENLVSEYCLVLLLMPMLIYFTNTLNVNCKFLSFLGSLSFGLYAYQCVLRVFEIYVPLEQHWLFLMLIAMVLIDKLIEFVYKTIKRKKEQKKIVKLNNCDV